MRIKEVVRESPILYPLAQQYHNIRQNMIISGSECIARYRDALSMENPNEVLERVERKIRGRNGCWPILRQSQRLKILLLTAANGWEYSSLYVDLKREFDVNFVSLESSGVVRRQGDITRTQVHNLILQVLENDSYDLILSYLSGAEIFPNTIEYMKSRRMPVVAFHWDDRLLFKGYRHDNVWSGPFSVAKNYDLNLTNAPSSLPKYRLLGAEAVFWPEGGHLRPLVTARVRDISVLFIGSNYGIRTRLIRYLSGAGVNIEAFGAGWPNGFVRDDQIPALIARSHIVLGVGFIGHSNFQCLKARDFEIPISGGLLLTSYHSELERVYEIGKEILTYRNNQDCLNKIKWCLEHSQEAELVRARGAAAARARHSWCERLKQLLEGRFDAYR